MQRDCVAVAKNANRFLFSETDLFEAFVHASSVRFLASALCVWNSIEAACRCRMRRSKTSNQNIYSTGWSQTRNHSLPVAKTAIWDYNWIKFNCKSGTISIYTELNMKSIISSFGVRVEHIEIADYAVQTMLTPYFLFSTFFWVKMRFFNRIKKRK